MKATRAALALALVATPAVAAPMIVDWPTFMRTGPGMQYVVMQELGRATPLEALSCGGGWCQVRLQGVIGYVEQSDLAAPSTLATLPQEPKSGAGCFASNIAGYEKGENYRFCQR